MNPENYRYLGYAILFVIVLVIISRNAWSRLKEVNESREAGPIDIAWIAGKCQEILQATESRREKQKNTTLLEGRYLYVIQNNPELTNMSMWAFVTVRTHGHPSIGLYYTDEVNHWGLIGLKSLGESLEGAGIAYEISKRKEIPDVLSCALL